jgi:hypothetical protein
MGQFSELGYPPPLALVSLVYRGPRIAGLASFPY